MSSLSAACATSAPNLFASSHPSLSPKPRFVFYKPSRLLCVKASSNPNHPISQILQSTAAGALLLSATAAALLTGAPLRARAEQPVTTEEQFQSQSHGSAVSEFLESNTDAGESLRSLLYQKLDDGEDTEALTIINHLISV